jgi:putative ABC transport system substrate-binding protein
MRRYLPGLAVSLLMLFGTGFRNPDLDRVYRIGVMITDDTYLAPVQGFRDGMRELGYLEGEHITYDIQNARLNRAALHGFAKRFVQERVDLIFTATYIGASVARDATVGIPIPIVFGPAGDPVETGLVKSILASGNNLTGVSTLSLELTAKRLEMLTRLVPGVRRVALLYNPDDRFSQEVSRLAHQAAERLDLAVLHLHGRDAEEIRQAMRALNRTEADAVFAIPDILVNNQVDALAAIARERRLPYMVHIRTLAEKGALASYGINTYQIGRQAARLADKIFNGARPSEIPIETPRKLELVVNLRVAKEIGVRIPEKLLREADALLR